ncbi:PEPxxWA-CTERM sorting domain-containing protein [Sphingomonas sp. dw_22]|uniref:PEPxxWA-CTERM sorting domain-containing protein n=1 Tax=Sphingomonas sp. dw_22 TaxID=2721175 RepID=UPI001BD640E8|nr:PEPxxWA-CTERM sorting domain-containing protein [Sphingomonas sp. dw_22]
MKITNLMAVSVAALLASTAAQAQVSGSLGNNGGAYTSLSGAGLGGGTVATLAGGTVYTSDLPFADLPAGSVFENTFLAAGPSSTSPATLTFGAGYGYLSFLWGSPDGHNLLTITTSLGNTATFTAAGLGFDTSGNQNFSQYVQFETLGTNEYISTVSFASSQDAFEAANFRVAGVPEASTWAMMIVGVGAAGGMLRRRRVRTSVSFA